jgi:hypothetical protein
MSNVAQEQPPATENGEAFDTLKEPIHRHGKEPDAPAPTAVDELKDELGDLAGDLTEIACTLKLLAERTDTDPLSGFLWGLYGVASRADSRLSEAVDALHKGHTENVGHRIEDVGAMALHLNNALRLAWETDETGGAASEMRSGTFAIASNAIDYVQERLDVLLYSDLSCLDE